MCNLNPFATKDRLASKKGFNLVDESNLKLDEPHKDFENVHITPEKNRLEAILPVYERQACTRGME